MVEATSDVTCSVCGDEAAICAAATWKFDRTVRILHTIEMGWACGDCGAGLSSPAFLVTDPMPEDPDAALILCERCAAHARHLPCPREVTDE